MCVCDVCYIEFKMLYIEITAYLLLQHISGKSKSILWVQKVGLKVVS